MRNYEQPKLEVLSFASDVITASTFNEQNDNAIENPWSMGEFDK